MRVEGFLEAGGGAVVVCTKAEGEVLCKRVVFTGTEVRIVRQLDSRLDSILGLRFLSFCLDNV
jgi:hypothetical protein